MARSSDNEGGAELSLVFTVQSDSAARNSILVNENATGSSRLLAGPDRGYDLSPTWR